MEVSRLRVLFLIALAATALPGCAMFGGDEEPATTPASVPAAESSGSTSAVSDESS